MMNDTSNEGVERDTLLLNTLMEVVPDAGLLAATTDILQNNGAEPRIIAMLRGYGTLLNIIQAAIELGEDESLPLYDRLSLGYYELTNRELE